MVVSIESRIPLTESLQGKSTLFVILHEDKLTRQKNNDLEAKNGSPKKRASVPFDARLACGNFI